MTQKPNNPWPIIAMLVIAGLLFSPSLKGCVPGLEIELPWPIGKVTFKPVAPSKPVEPPKTRCLIFGFSSCPACKQLERIIRREVIPHGWRYGPLSTDDIEEIDVRGNDRRLKKYKHSSYPTLIIVDQNEIEVSRRTWPITGQELITWIQSTR